MYAQDMLILPGTWLRRVRLWYARGRTWRQGTYRLAASPLAGSAPRPTRPDAPKGTPNAAGARAG